MATIYDEIGALAPDAAEDVNLQCAEWECWLDGEGGKVSDQQDALAWWKVCIDAIQVIAY